MSPPKRSKSSSPTTVTEFGRLSLSEIASALKCERRPAIRKRLRALVLLHGGKSIEATAKALKVDPESIRRWRNRTMKHGLSALCVDGRGQKSIPLITSRTAQEVTAEINRALKRRPHWRLRKKLDALRLVLNGKLDEAATSAHVSTTTVERWLHSIRRSGIAAFLAKSELKSYAPRLDIDAAALREQAAMEWNPRIRKRMLAVAYVAEGMGYYDAGVAAGLLHGTVMLWVQRVLADGVGILLK